MKKFREMLTGGDKGFTLIELLVVIAVLGILIAIAVPRMTGITNNAEISAAKADLRTIQTGLEVFYASEDNEYPSDLSSIGAYVNISGTDLDDEDIYTYSTTGGYTVSTSAGGKTITLTPGGISEE